MSLSPSPGERRCWRPRFLPVSGAKPVSSIQVFFGPKPENYRDALKCDKELYRKFWSRMLENGVFLPPSQFETCFLSTAHERRDVQDTLRAFVRSLGALK